MARSPRIFLIGSRGSGKTTVGRVLSDLLKWNFVDCDELVEQQAGQSIASIFATEGETSFRNRESEVLRGTAHLNETVVATGGGAVVRAANRAVMHESGFCAWLTAGADTLWARVVADDTTAERRPPLTNVSGRREIEAVLQDRIRFYTETAHVIVNTEGETPDAIARTIMDAWNS